MIPDGVLSSQPHQAAFSEKSNQRNVPLVDYERGGTALQNPNDGLSVKLWTLRCTDGHAVTVEADDVAPMVLFARPGTIELVSLAFDQNMNPHVAFVEDGVSWLWWWDTLANAMAFMTIPEAVTPRLGMDEKRSWNMSASDVMLCYIRKGRLCQRLQRERFATETILNAGPFDSLAIIGRQVGDRFQYAMTAGTGNPIDPLAESILAKLTAWWPLDSVNGSKMADKQPDVLVGGMTDAYLQYGPSLNQAPGRTAGRYAPAYGGNASPGGYITEVSSAGGPAPVENMFPSNGDWCSFGWVYLNASPVPAMAIVTRYDANDSGGTASVGMRYLDGGNGRIQGWFGAGDQSSIVPSGNVAVGKWVFMLLQRRSGLMRMYVDGQPLGTEINVSVHTPNNHYHTYFGSQGPHLFLNGRLQDWGWIKGKSLTDQELEWLYNDGDGRTIQQIRQAAGME